MLTLFRKKKKNLDYTRVGLYDQEDTIFIKVFLRLWGLIPNWLSALILFSIGIYIITLAAWKPPYTNEVLGDFFWTYYQWNQLQPAKTISRRRRHPHRIIRHSVCRCRSGNESQSSCHCDSWNRCSFFMVNHLLIYNFPFYTDNPLIKNEYL